MSELAVHVLLFALVSFVIVALSSFYSDRSDAAAWRAVPRRLLVFLASCAAVAALMLFCERFFASVH